MENSPKNAMSGKNVHRFTVNVDHVQYFVTAEPFSFNDQVRYKITVNDRQPDILVWDTDVDMYRPVGDDATVLPDGLLRGINDKLMALTA